MENEKTPQEKVTIANARVPQESPLAHLSGKRPLTAMAGRVPQVLPAALFEPNAETKTQSVVPQNVAQDNAATAATPINQSQPAQTPQSPEQG
jgi:hypothetical protein